MLLSSSLEPSGPKSKDHYLVLHHDKRRELIKLPRSFSELKKEVQRLYHIDPNRFHVETNELNVCAGERLRIPEDAWSDLAELLCNVFVVPSGAIAVPDSGPESIPEIILEIIPETEIVSETQDGVIPFATPLATDEVIVISLGDIDFNTEPASLSDLTLELLDETKSCVVAMSYSPQNGLTSFASTTNLSSTTHLLKDAFRSGSDNRILIYKQHTRFLLLFGNTLVGAVETPAHSPLSYATYDLGLQSPFIGPVSGRVHPSLSHLRGTLGPIRALSLPMDKDTLFRQILAGNPQDAAKVSKQLEDVRKETMSFKDSASGVKWRTFGPFPDSRWTELEWDLQPRSVFVIRYKLLEASTGRLDFHFNHKSPDKHPLHVDVYHPSTVRFSEHNPRRVFEEYHTINLLSSMHTAGDHSVAFIVDSEKVHISFDFRQSTVLPRDTMLEFKPDDICLSLNSKCSVEADVYEFNN